VPSLSELIFPPLCWHCQEKSDTKEQLFCAACRPFFELIPPQERCPYCFCEEEAGVSCATCRQSGVLLRMAAALPAIGPVKTLVREVKYGRTPFLIKSGAAFMLLQFFHLAWPQPDWLIPVPKRLWFKSKNHATLLAEELAKALGAPLLKCVGRHLIQQNENPYFFKSGHSLADQTLLIVDDLIDSGTTMRQMAEVLKAGYPKRIYGLALAA
jgi:predicted amidophosphoribosyltransferase